MVNALEVIRRGTKRRAYRQNKKLNHYAHFPAMGLEK